MMSARPEMLVENRADTVSAERHLNFATTSGGTLPVRLVERRPATKIASVRDDLGRVVEVAYGDSHDVIVDRIVLGTVTHHVDEVEIGESIAMREKWSREAVDFSLGYVPDLDSEYDAIVDLLTAYRKL